MIPVELYLLSGFWDLRETNTQTDYQRNIYQFHVSVSIWFFHPKTIGILESLYQIRDKKVDKTYKNGKCGSFQRNIYDTLEYLLSNKITKIHKNLSKHLAISKLGFDYVF